MTEDPQLYTLEELGLPAPSEALVRPVRRLWRPRLAIRRPRIVLGLPRFRGSAVMASSVAVIVLAA